MMHFGNQISLQYSGLSFLFFIIYNMYSTFTRKQDEICLWLKYTINLDHAATCFTLVGIVQLATAHKFTDISNYLHFSN